MQHSEHHRFGRGRSKGSLGKSRGCERTVWGQAAGEERVQARREQRASIAIGGRKEDLGAHPQRGLPVPGIAGDAILMPRME